MLTTELELRKIKDDNQLKIKNYIEILNKINNIELILVNKMKTNYNYLNLLNILLNDSIESYFIIASNLL